MKKLITICAVVVLFPGTAYASWVTHGCLYDGTNWTTIEPPEAGHSVATGMDGDTIVGYYTTTNMGGIVHGFVYDATGYDTLDNPQMKHTAILGTDGSNHVGQCTDDGGNIFGFRYDVTAQHWHDINHPEGYPTSVSSIDGDLLVGYYVDDSGGESHRHGFLYDWTIDNDNWTYPLDPSGAQQTIVEGIDGTTLVGRYTEADDFDVNAHGFIYDLATKDWTMPLDKEGESHTLMYDTDGGNHVGAYYSGSYTNPQHGFVYDGTTWTDKDWPGMHSTSVAGIDGSNLVGCYRLIPEPSSLVLLSMGAVGLLIYAWRKRRRR